MTVLPQRPRIALLHTRGGFLLGLRIGQVGVVLAAGALALSALNSAGAGGVALALLLLVAGIAVAILPVRGQTLNSGLRSCCASRSRVLTGPPGSAASAHNSARRRPTRRPTQPATRRCA